MRSQRKRVTHTQKGAGYGAKRDDSALYACRRTSCPPSLDATRRVTTPTPALMFFLIYAEPPRRRRLRLRACAIFLPLLLSFTRRHVATRRLREKNAHTMQKEAYVASDASAAGRVTSIALPR